MLKGGYQIIDLDGYNFTINSGGGEPYGHEITLSDELYEPFKSKKAKLFSGFTVMGVTYDDSFAECVRTTETDNEITKRFHMHIEIKTGTEFNNTKPETYFDFTLDKITKTVKGKWVY